MLFNSVDFAIFLPTVFILYWFVVNKNLKIQNAFVVAASYFFYGWWDWRFLSLIVFSTLLDYLVGRALEHQENVLKRKVLLWTSVLVNIGFLGVFKYFNFFLENFIMAFSLFGVEMRASSLSIILPVGISFYTFQTLSYTIDVYRRKLEPTHDFVSFAAFVCFFPQLVAGPIERAKNLLPQFYKPRKFNFNAAADGMRQILWGLFKKVVIADTCAHYADIIFNNSADLSGSTLVLGTILFAFQIYGDFSGYSDIAIGTSRLFGFNLSQNFAFPYFSRDIAEFWRRWHISLSTWFRDYLYIPLGGSRGGTWMKVRNVFILFLVSGFWHGANWNYIFWGGLNALLFLPLLLFNKNRSNLEVVAKGKLFPPLRDLGWIVVTFTINLFAWILFRSATIGDAMRYTAGIFKASFFTIPDFLNWRLVGLIAVLIMVEWLQREKQHGLDWRGIQLPAVIRWGVYLIMVFLISAFFGKPNTFIYFQF